MRIIELIASKALLLKNLKLGGGCLPATPLAGTGREEHAVEGDFMPDEDYLEHGLVP